MSLPNNINIQSDLTWKNASMSDRIHLFEKILTSQTPPIPMNTTIPMKTTIPMNPQLKSCLLKLISKRKATIQQLFEATGIQLDPCDNSCNNYEAQNSCNNSEAHNNCVSYTTTFYVGLICCVGGFAIASYLKV